MLKLSVFNLFYSGTHTLFGGIREKISVSNNLSLIHSYSVYVRLTQYIYSLFNLNFSVTKVLVKNLIHIWPFWYHIAHHLIGLRVIELAAYCNQKLLAHLYHNSTQNTSVNWIIRLLVLLLCWTNVILLSGGRCI